MDRFLKKMGSVVNFVAFRGLVWANKRSKQAVGYQLVEIGIKIMPFALRSAFTVL